MGLRFQQKDRPATLRVVLNLPVAIGAIAIIATLLLFGGLWPDVAGQIFKDAQAWILTTFGWFYILAVAILLITAIGLALSRFGQLKFGPDDAKPDYSFPTWLAMLFAAGMGIGLMYFAVAEPIQHFAAPPEATPRSIAAMREAMVITFFHWGVHAWAIYGIVGLSLAYFGYRYNLPLTIRSGLYPLLKERINGPIGHAVDIFAICSTLFGIATSLGLGVLQINAGLRYLFGLPETIGTQVTLIAIVTAIATISVVSGLDVGIRRLSELNLALALLLMLFVLAAGPTAMLLQDFVQNIGLYLGAVVPRTFNIYAYEPRDWIRSWTLFYWAWWIAWSPFVGMFIARISRGRTVQEFVTGVLFVPAILTFLWMTVFGNTALFIDTKIAGGALTTAVEQNVSVALFQFFQYLPMPAVTSGLAVLLVSVFFVTSADSGSLVIDTLASGGRENTPALQRIFWCVLEGSTAAILLLAGGLSALQTATIAAALPFAVVILLLCWGLLKGMAADIAGREAMRAQVSTPSAVAAHWRHRIGLLLHTPRHEDVERFLAQIVTPALEAVAAEFTTRGVDAHVNTEDDRRSLVVPTKGIRDFVYGIETASHALAGFGLRDVSGPDADRPRAYEARTFFSDGGRGYNIMGLSREEIIADILNQFEAYRALVGSPLSSLYATSPDPERLGGSG